MPTEESLHVLHLFAEEFLTGEVLEGKSGCPAMRALGLEQAVELGEVGIEPGDFPAVAATVGEERETVEDPLRTRSSAGPGSGLSVSMTSRL